MHTLQPHAYNACKACVWGVEEDTYTNSAGVVKLHGASMYCVYTTLLTLRCRLASHRAMHPLRARRRGALGSKCTASLKVSALKSQSQCPCMLAIKVKSKLSMDGNGVH